MVCYLNAPAAVCQLPYGIIAVSPACSHVRVLELEANFLRHQRGMGISEVLQNYWFSPLVTYRIAFVCFVIAHQEQDMLEKMVIISLVIDLRTVSV